MQMNTYIKGSVPRHGSALSLWCGGGLTPVLQIKTHNRSDHTHTKEIIKQLNYSGEKWWKFMDKNTHDDMNDAMENKFMPMISFRSGMGQDRKSTRLNSSHVAISYAVFCLKKK